MFPPRVIRADVLCKLKTYKRVFAFAVWTLASKPDALCCWILNQQLANDNLTEGEAAALRWSLEQV